MFEILRDLSQHPGPVGRGADYNRWLSERWRSICPELEQTVKPPGNLLVKVGGHGPRVAVIAHADEIGFVVQSVHQDGLLAIAPAIPDRDGRPVRRMGLHVAGQPALVLGESGPVEGVFVTFTGHVLTQEQRSAPTIRWRDFWVDVGCESAAECAERGILPGTPIVWNPPVRRLGRRIVGKAMDDRAGLAILETVLKETRPETLGCELWLVSTVMEESYALGAWALSAGHTFDAALILDVGLSRDCPAVSGRDVVQRMGDGGVLVTRDNMCHYDIHLIRALEACATAHNVPVSRAAYGVDGSYTSDGVRLIAAGVRTALLAFPTAYTHCPYEMVVESDLRACADLVLRMAEEWSQHV